MWEKQSLGGDREPDDFRQGIWARNPEGSRLEGLRAPGFLNKRDEFSCAIERAKGAISELRRELEVPRHGNEAATTCQHVGALLTRLAEFGTHILKVAMTWNQNVHGSVMTNDKLELKELSEILTSLQAFSEDLNEGRRDLLPEDILRADIVRRILHQTTVFNDTSVTRLTFAISFNERLECNWADGVRYSFDSLQVLYRRIALSPYGDLELSTKQLYEKYYTTIDDIRTRRGLGTQAASELFSLISILHARAAENLARSKELRASLPVARLYRTLIGRIAETIDSQRVKAAGRESQERLKRSLPSDFSPLGEGRLQGICRCLLTEELPWFSPRIFAVWGRVFENLDSIRHEYAYLNANEQFE